MKHGAPAMALLVAVGAAQGAVTEIGEFAGGFVEGFENILPPNGGGYPGPIDIFQGEATFDDSVAHFVQIAISLSSFLTGEDIFPQNGNLMGGSVTGWGLFTFETPVTQFGGYFGTADLLEGGVAIFRDASGAEIETLSIDIAEPGQWQWHGWHSDVAFASVEVRGHMNPGGGPVVYDDLRFVVPAPGAASMLAFGAAPLLRRRR